MNWIETIAQKKRNNRCTTPDALLAARFEIIAPLVYARGLASTLYLRMNQRAVLLLLMTATPALAGGMSDEACEELGGVNTTVGCILADSIERETYRKARVYEFTPEECVKAGGKYHPEHNCLANFSDEECAERGGQPHPELGCVQVLSKEMCAKLGGILKSDGGCEF